MFLNLRNLNLALMATLCMSLAACSGSMEAADIQDMITPSDKTTEEEKDARPNFENFLNVDDEALVEQVLQKLDADPEVDFQLENYTSLGDQELSAWVTESLVAADITLKDDNFDFLIPLSDNSSLQLRLVFSEEFSTEVLQVQDAAALQNASEGELVAIESEQALRLVGAECTNEVANRCVLVLATQWEGLNGLLVLFNSYDPKADVSTLHVFSRDENGLPVFKEITGPEAYGQQQLEARCTADPLHAPDDCLALFGMSEEEDTLKFMVMSLCTTGQAQGKTKAQCSERFEQYCSESAIATSSNSDVQEQLCSAMEEQIVDATIGGTEASLHDQRLQE